MPDVTIDCNPEVVFQPGMELEASNGTRWIVVGVHAPSHTLGIKRSTWWRRLYWRVRRLWS